MLSVTNVFSILHKGNHILSYIHNLVVMDAVLKLIFVLVITLK